MATHKIPFVVYDYTQEFQRKFQFLKDAQSLQSGFEHSTIDFIFRRFTVFATTVLFKHLNFHVYFLLHFKANYPSENGKLSIAITFELIPNPNSKSS